MKVMDEIVDHFLPTQEMPFLFSEMKFMISSLYKLPLRSPAPVNRFADRAVADMSLYQHFDILYVRDKLPLANVNLAARLGKLITRRRQLLASRSAHDKALLTEDTEPDPIAIPAVSQESSRNEDVEQVPQKMPAPHSSVAPSVSQASGSGHTRLTTATILRQDLTPDDTHANFGRPAISEYAPSMASSYASKLRIEIPDRPRGSNGKELEYFKCPYCCVLTKSGTARHWK